MGWLRHLRVTASALFFFSFSTTSQAFSVVVVVPSLARGPRNSAVTRVSSVSEPNEGNGEKLILGAEPLQQQMNQLKLKYPTSEAAYLAAARARAAAQVQSKERGATDEDWKRIAAQKKSEMGDLPDDWEESAKEAGNADSQILIPMGDNEIEEPKLLL